MGNGAMAKTQATAPILNSTEGAVRWYPADFRR